MSDINNNRVVIPATKKISVFPTVRPALTYHLETPSNNALGLLNLVVDVTNTVTDSVPIVGGGTTTVTSNGTAIIISSQALSQNVDGGTF